MQRQWVDDYYHGLKYTYMAVLSLVATDLTVVHSIGFGSVAFSFSSLIGRFHPFTGHEGP